MKTEDDYLKWLERYVYGTVTFKPTKSHSLLFETLYGIKFRVSPRTKNDSNRCEDGLAIRSLFIDATNYDGTFYTGKCTVLELFVALADRMNYQVEKNHGTRYWFESMMDNMGILYNDQILIDEPSHVYDIETIIGLWISKKYSSDGVGSPFPIKNDKIDHRQMEIWYQMMGYISEFYDE